MQASDGKRGKMVDVEKLLGLPKPFTDAGIAIAAYVEAMENYAALDNTFGDVSADLHVLDEYLGGAAGDDILDSIARMTEEEGLGEESPTQFDSTNVDDDDDNETVSNLMDFDDAKYLREQKEHYQTYYEKKLNRAEIIVVEKRLAARHELRKALSERLEPDDEMLKSAGYEELKLALMPCLEHQRQMADFLKKNKSVTEAISKALAIAIAD